MSELLPCPFCSAEPEIWSDGRRTWGLVQHNDGCLFPTYPKHEIPETDFAAWNTRAERTCKLKFATERMSCTDRWCSECDADLSDVPIEYTNYCPNCGRKVVDDGQQLDEEDER